MKFFFKGRSGILILLLLCVSEVFSQNPPIANYDLDTADQSTTLTVPAPGVLVNDSDPDGDTITVTRFFVGGLTFVAGATATIAEGSITINADGSYVFIPTAGYSGHVPIISYEITDGTNLVVTALYLTVETDAGLLDIQSISSCNQGYTADGNYKVQYWVVLSNTSLARDNHANSKISNIQVFNNLNAIFGNSCVTEVERLGLGVNSSTLDPLRIGYPAEFNGGDYDTVEFSETDPTPGAESIFNTGSMTNMLHPGQRINITYCLTIDPTCAGSPVDFNNAISVTSNRGNDSRNRLITDFHITETTVAASLYIPDVSPTVNFDGTFDYTNTVIITNDGTANATNVNYNMGLKSFIDNGIVFSMVDHDNDITTPDVQTPFVQQVDASGAILATPTVNVNPIFDGMNNSKLLLANQPLSAGESIFLQVVHHINPITGSSQNNFVVPQLSMSQGLSDGFDEEFGDNPKYLSFVIWSDALGNHMDKYYNATNQSDPASSLDQCNCTGRSMSFDFLLSLLVNKTIVSIVTAPSGVEEHKAVTFRIRITNSNFSSVRAVNINLLDDLLGICNDNIIQVSTPTILASSNAEEIPTINAGYDGVSNTNIFDGISGIINPNEFVEVEFTTIISDDCIGFNTASFSGSGPLNGNTLNIGSVAVTISSDNDNDGITNNNDIDDDNDGIPDTVEYNGLDPLADADNDAIPNYRDTDFGVDANNDGIVDVFDFDNDGVPNHFDLDSDNDGIADIIESGIVATTTNGTTNNPVGANGLDDTIESNDTLLATIDVTLIVNTDNNGNPNYLDIDSDNDGIVDNIEAQASDAYLTPNNVVNANGFDTAYPSGLNPVDSDMDTVFDYIDINSDNDIKDDILEAWDANNDSLPDTIPSGIDSDNDGLDDNFDVDGNSNINNGGASNGGQVPQFFPNNDEPTTPELDWRELLAIIIRIDDVTVTEGNDLVFNMQIVTKNDTNVSSLSSTNIDIDVFTMDGTTATVQYDIAISPFDYTGIASATPTTFTIPAFQSSIQVTIPSIDDTIFELDEFFTFNATVTSGNTFDPNAFAIGLIQDNDNPPDITMNDTREFEGDDLVHTIVISNPSSTPVIIDISTIDDEAISPEDYTSFINTITIDGTIDETNPNIDITFNIPTIVDNLSEPDEERLFVNGIVTTTNVATEDLNKEGVILDIDPLPTIAIDSPIVTEGETLLFTFTTDIQHFEDIEVQLVTTNGTATAPLDYDAITTTIIISAFSNEATVEVISKEDTLTEDAEDFNLIGIVTTLNTQNINPTTIGTILDNDVANLFSPNGDGVSDVFEIRALYDYPNFKLQIFDRWGSLIRDYSNNGNSSPTWWNGEIDFNPAPEGVYFYTIDFNDGIHKPKSGFIQLTR
ncbi:MAG: gliding motility-associated C-terminal domain-containing protein [Flavobacteriaceae bacterium]